MGYWADKEREELERLYPPGTRERHILEYSAGKREQEEVPPMLVAAFRVLMGITIFMAMVGFAVFISTM